MDLFQARGEHEHEPLAARMRPRDLDEFVGQDHIVGPGRLLRRAIQADQLSSLVFYGPPGTGKTTLARVVANTTRSQFLSLNAVLSGVKDVRQAIDQAKQHRDLYGNRTMLFVDEVHRWNKAQQDALLPWVENGTIILIGATTENPYFEVNSALVSRSRIFQLKPLDEDDLYRVARQALTDTDRGYGKWNVEFAPGALEHLVHVANGDARSLLNALELAVETTPERFPPPPGETIHISMEAAEESIQQRAVLYDKEGDYHFDTISAFIKSMRGSDPDAALYWLARMVRAGESPRFVFRRMLIAASEDVGMADPRALQFVEAAAAAFDRVGMPEGMYHLAHAALYLATAPKSNSTMGVFDAVNAVEEEQSREVPNHLKDANRDAKGFGHGDGYLYPHAYRDHWVAQQYLPTALRARVFYQPSRVGYESTIHDDVARRREAALAASMEAHGGSEEILTFSPPDRARERWIRRSAESRSGTVAAIRERIFDGAAIARHHRVMIVGARRAGLLVWEALRLVPEGVVVAQCASEADAEALRDAAERLAEVERPLVVPRPLNAAEIGDETGIPTFEHVLGMNALTRANDRAAVFGQIRMSLSPGGVCSLGERIPSKGQRLSAFLSDGRVTPDILQALGTAEDELYARREDPRLGWDEHGIVEDCDAAGLHVSAASTQVFQEQRMVSRQDVTSWLAPEGETYGSFLRRRLGDDAYEEVRSLLTEKLADQVVPWTSTYVFLKATAS
jgi:putative ATPase